MSYVYDYAGAGFRIFALWEITKEGKCGCGDPECPPEAAGKHPRISKWQDTPHWSDEQLDNIVEHTIETGFGVCVDQHLIIDIDPRNGGAESYKQLVIDTGIDFKKESGFVVETGGGGHHIYFNRPAGSYLGKLDKYKGIDFKTSGFVVGCTSLHRAGTTYESEKGHPDDLTDAPQALIDLLLRPEYHRADIGGEAVDLCDDDILKYLSIIDPDCDYDTWVQCGMAIHHTTSGQGFELWNDWSNRSAKYPGRGQLDRHWHSFGKSANPVTVRTLIHHAETYGYQESVTFEPKEEIIIGDHPFAVDTVDLMRPPGFVGELTKWIDAQCRYKRENLAVGAALVAMGNVCGLRYKDPRDGVSLNMFAFARSPSATGKEAVQQAMADIHRAAGINAASHGSIKSEQEIIRNLTRHQAAYYIVDEIGILLSKITNAQQRGGAAYLEGVIGMLMQAYSKATGYMLLTGDAKEDVRKALANELATCRKAVSEHDDESGFCARRLPQIERALAGLDNGLERPFLSLMGYTTPVTFDSVVTFEQCTNGFIGRSLLINEPESNPKARKGFKKEKMSTAMESTLRHLYCPGFDMMAGARVEYYGEQVPVGTEKAADIMLDQVQEFFHNYAERHKSETGLEAVVRRAYEMVAKISIVLAVPSGLRTSEHVRWAYALARRDVDEKINLAYGNMMDGRKDKESQINALASKILDIASGEEGERMGVITNRCRKWDRASVEGAIANLVKSGYLEEVQCVHAGNGKEYLKYRKVYT